MHWRQSLRIKTRDPAFLWKMTIAVLALGLAGGYLVHFLPGSAGRSISEQAAEPTDALQHLVDLLADPRTPFESVLDALPWLSVSPAAVQVLRHPDSTGDQGLFLGNAQVTRLLLNSELDGDRRKIALGLTASLERGEPDEALLDTATRKPQVAYSHFALGVFWAVTGDFSRAGAAYEQEGRLPEADEARRRAVEMFSDADDFESLRRLGSDPRYAPTFTMSARLQLAAGSRDWVALWWLIPPAVIERLEPGPVALALFAGLCWFLFAIHAGQVDAPHGARWWLCAAAVPLGILSIWPTMWLIYWQEAEWDMVRGDDLLGAVRYFVLGVGLREEFSKLILLLPLVPFLAVRRNPLEVLIVSSCVGLGFAVVENERYFSFSMGVSAVGRFLTANFFHMAATGLIGLGLLRAVWNPRQRLHEAVLIFAGVVMAHGLYDTAISVDEIGSYGYASFLIYVLLAYGYFHELRTTREDRVETVSLTATFLCGVSLLAAMTLVYVNLHLDFKLTFAALGTELVSLALIVYMFLREMPGSMVRV